MEHQHQAISGDGHFLIQEKPAPASVERVSSNLLTALILTFNEEDNIERVLNELQWLERVVIVDSFSTDSTIALIKKYPNTQIHYRKFDTFATQCNFGLSLLRSKWVLSLDADYVLTPDFVSETKRFIGDGTKNAYFAKFKFAVFGTPLLKNNTTPRAVLFRSNAGSYYDDGHAHRLRVRGETGAFNAFIVHDDRKPLSRWLTNLDGYSIKECRKMLDARDPGHNTMIQRIRRTKVLAPFLVFFYCLIVNGAVFDGWRGWHYTLQRVLVEILFALRLIEEQKLKDNSRSL
jgi:glycosyltransferase involved in cell wall biosynthesis